MDSDDKKKKKKRVMRKASKLFISLGITSVILVVATYAWFIGTLQVTVSGIEIQIEAKEGLTISLDGNAWTNDIVVNKAAVTTDLTEAYPTNSNSWVNEDDHGGMLPVSTVGKLDSAHSVLELYSKSSITALKGGYRVRTNKIDNYDTANHVISESGEYVVFDIFVKNTSGDGYNATYDPAEDEGIYLINQSYAHIVGTNGDGIQNSARIGLFEIGRTGFDASIDAIQAISCAGGVIEGGDETDDLVTGLCNLGEDSTPTAAGQHPKGQGITWNIYEPNDLAHVEKSVQRYTRICLKRTDASTYDGECDELTDNMYVKTYAVHGPIVATDNVNIFDGLNDYTSNIYTFDPDEPNYEYTTSQKLTEMTYYTDSDIIDSNEDTRHEVIRLAPNSITKIRVYIWIEGQDVDNYDVVKLDDDGEIIDTKISIQFGFTKDRFAYLEVDPGELEHGEGGEEGDEDEGEPYEYPGA